MASRTRKVITSTFLLTTIVFIIIVGYTTYIYFIVYVGIRNFNTTVPRLNVKVSDTSYARVETAMVLQNPSECTFEIRSIAEGLWLEGEFLLNKRESWVDPIPMPPMSTVNVTIEAQVPSHKIQYVKTQLDKRWVALIRVSLNAPVVGGFSWEESWLITEITQT